MLAGKGSCWLGSDHGRDSGISWHNIEIHKPAVFLYNRRIVLAAHAGVERQTGVHSPIIGRERIVGRGSKIFIGVAEGDVAGIGDSKLEIGEIRPSSQSTGQLCRRAGKCKTT